MANLEPESEKVAAPAEEEESFGGCDACSGVRCTPEGLVGAKSYDWKFLCTPSIPCLVKETKAPPLLKPSTKLPLLVAIIMGLQHSLAMLGGIITPPSLIAGDACFAGDTELCGSRQYMISAALIASGLLSLVQILRFKLCGGYTLGTGLISVMGTSFTFLPIAREVVSSEIRAGTPGKEAYGKFLGTCLVASITEILISFVPPRHLKKLFPPVVSGTCVTLIGAGLIGSGLKYWGGGVFCAENDMSRAAAFGGPQMCTGNGDVVLAYGAPQYFGLGFSVVTFLVLIQALGSPFLKNCSVAMALFFGYFCAGVSSYTPPGSSQALAFVNTDKLDAAGTFTFLWTTTFPLGFYAPAFLPLLLGFVITSVETVGDIQATSDVSGLPLEGPQADSRIQGGLLADGVNSAIAVLMTSPPNTTFSQNNGVIAITRCASRAAGIACCIWLILFGCFQKFGATIASIPDCVVGGMTTFLFANVFVSGINIVTTGEMTRRTRFILAIALGVGVGVSALPSWAEGGGVAAFHGANLKHNIGLWPASDVCEVFPTVEVETAAATCTVNTYTSSTMSQADCTAMSGTWTAAVTEQQTVTTCPGTSGGCCLKYNASKKMWRDSLIIIMKTPYCIGTLLALFLHLILPFESESEEELGEAPAKVLETAEQDV
eukprot:CAMPEP_0181441454 /NCGR_PEP_ID=MMETSP1110-20121109/23519_1 /TAXON_ID=174948 /ORGANISM="Symbiodinium sp., Strain CCMP421" /LENGTH=658 /DNA_ID=CAMNT_0023565345 /DNA_START=46 /DNA_END=2022 /DNA_ORIENTATION=+